MGDGNDDDGDDAFYVPCIVCSVLVSNMVLAYQLYRLWIHWQNVSISLAYLNSNDFSHEICAITYTEYITSL